MPGQDRTGPLGMGTRTGKGMGTFAGPQAGIFTGNGRACRGQERGFGRCGSSAMAMTRNPEQVSKESLAEQKEFLQARLAEVTAQLEKL